mmetsp:Transcript_119/g.255  ORF Transcript_119/g.255 Transcript_119/m.255 type:complete len:231 (+) Transcript_119:303-995(+)
MVTTSSPTLSASSSSSCTVNCRAGTTSSSPCTTSSPLSTLIDTVRSSTCVTGSKLSNSAPHSTMSLVPAALSSGLPAPPMGTSQISRPPSPTSSVPSNRSPGCGSSSSSSPPLRSALAAAPSARPASLLVSMWQKVPSRHMTMSYPSAGWEGEGDEAGDGDAALGDDPKPLDCDPADEEEVEGDDVVAAGLAEGGGGGGSCSRMSPCTRVTLDPWASELLASAACSFLRA